MRALKYKLDNEFELVFVVGYQKSLPLLYLDKLLDEIRLKFRDRYMKLLKEMDIYRHSQFDGFTNEFQAVLATVERKSNAEKEVVKAPRSFEQVMMLIYELAIL